MKIELRALVSQLVEEFLEEAFTREMYVDRLVNAAKGAMGEYFKARYAEVNADRRLGGREGTMEGWDREVDNHFTYNVLYAITSNIKSGDRRKAFDQALASLRRLVPAYLRAAKRHVAESFLTPERELDDPSDQATDEFFARLENLFDESTADVG